MTAVTVKHLESRQDSGTERCQLHQLIDIIPLHCQRIGPKETGLGGYCLPDNQLHWHEQQFWLTYTRRTDLAT